MIARTAAITGPRLVIIHFETARLRGSVCIALLGGVVASERKWVKAKRVVEGMEPWFRDINKRVRKPNRDGRTTNEECFDSGVFAASEMIRRLTGDEELALAVHEVCIWRQNEHKEDRATEYSST